MRIRGTYRLTENLIFMYVLQTDFKQVYYDYIFRFQKNLYTRLRRTLDVEYKTFKHVYLHNNNFYEYIITVILIQRRYILYFEKNIIYFCTRSRRCRRS